MKLNPNIVFLKDNLPTSRIIALQGGTRSGKTYSALQYIVSLIENFSGLTISIVRESFPSLRASALRDFKDILEDAELYDEANEKKPAGYYEYHHNGNIVEFFSVDNQQKVRGRKRDILYINEANEISIEKFRQLAFRTTGRIIIDYNPSDSESYIYDQVLTRNDCELLITTYKDNPHLPQEIINEIEILEDADPEYWKVFGEGVRGKTSGIILSHYKVCLADEYPINAGEKVYGLDFGFTAPSSLVEVTLYDNRIYARQRIYQRKLTNPELILVVKSLGLPPNAPIYCDHAEPDRITEFNRAGFNALKCDKNIKDGIDSLRAKPLYIHEDSKDLITEIKSYRYKKNKSTDEFTEEPIAINDHALDALRYAVYTHQKQPKVKNRASRPVKRDNYFNPS